MALFLLFLKGVLGMKHSSSANQFKSTTLFINVINHSKNNNQYITKYFLFSSNYIQMHKLS